AGTRYAWQQFSLPNDVASGGRVRLSLNFSQLKLAGAMYVEYQMVKAQEFWFDYFADPAATVIPLWSAVYGVTNTPTSWGAAQGRTYTVTLTNNGSSTWNAGDTPPVSHNDTLSPHDALPNSAGTRYAWQQFSLPNDVAS